MRSSDDADDSFGTSRLCGTAGGKWRKANATRLPEAELLACGDHLQLQQADSAAEAEADDASHPDDQELLLVVAP